MNNEKYNQIIDEVWKYFSNVRKSMLMLKPPASENKLREYIEWYEQITTKEEFIDKCKTDSEFSKKWGLKIEKRELSYNERFRIAYKDLELRKKLESESKMLHFPDGHNKVMDESNIPTKLITVTYNNETMEIYE